MDETTSPNTLGDRLEHHRQALTPVPSFRQLERRLVTRIGEYAPSGETLRRWHRHGVELPDVDLVILTCLAEIYGCTVEQLSPSAAKMFADLGITGIPCFRNSAAA